MKPLAKVIRVNGHKAVGLALSPDDAVLLRELLGRALVDGPTSGMYHALRNAGVPSRSGGEEGRLQVPNYNARSWKPPTEEQWAKWRRKGEELAK